jgi:hypothetical protein
VNFTKFFSPELTAKLGHQLLKVQKVSPTALFVGGTVGVVVTAVLASKATMQMDDVLNKLEHDKDKSKELHAAIPEEYSETDHKKDMVIIYSRATVDIAKLYAPAVIVGGLSIAALTGSHIILTRRNAALTAAYAALDKGFREYRKRVVDEYGEDVDRRFRYSTELVPAEEKTQHAKQFKMDPNEYSIYARFFDQTCPSWDSIPEYNFLFLKCQQNWANDMLRARGHVFLNEVYDRLGIDRTKAGAVVGWVRDSGGDNFVDFGIFDGDNPRARDFVNGREGSILLDFNVDGVIYDLI